ncbi:MFS transporter [Pseudoclavibacter sp. RFBJ3]|uniref:MFS transporter n=1 Tax=unclassified Pseudoclavibacter TaxID=2615177 RepID=UPI000CE7493F|nr:MULTISPECIES: MFS transporter [unclassified Pseudoclavibacter]PPF80879.1 MFS transporter [Pseudoclavibacter sp. RFBJ5]PPF94388.1 MFS transporter [Pseudoclavibacter sp. RFBJ3]PPF99495.1 MFS transporter [Pseudoclavibacter sp. RFBH5]PPG25689.1 MFS transporter [Pseudoclavibacter sp. RFBI4]
MSRTTGPTTGPEQQHARNPPLEGVREPSSAAPSTPAADAPTHVWRTRRPGRTATIAGIGTTVVTALPVFLVGGLSMQLRASTGLTESMLGIVVAAYWGASALLSPLAGSLSTRLGFRWGMVMASSIGGLALIGIAAYTPTWQWLLVWLIVAGAGNSLGHPPSNALIGVGVSTRRRALAFGFKQGAVPLATFSAGLAVPALGLTVGWQWTFAIAGALAAVAVAFLAWRVPRTPRTPRATRRTRERLPRDLRVFLILASAASGLGAAQSSVIGAFTVTTAIGVGYTAAVAGLLLSLGSLANIIARPLAGWLADRGIGGTLTTVSLMMLSGAIGLGGMALALPWSFAIGVVLAFGLGWGWSGLLHYAVSNAVPRFAAQATGLVQSGAYIGSAAGPFAMGFVFEYFGPTTGWLAAAGIALIAATTAAIAAQFHPTRRRARAEARAGSLEASLAESREESRVDDQAGAAT